jgi:DNA repair protein RecN (Recombination protein N)
VRRLEGKPRQEEVARMLSGAKVTDEARAAARKLISEVL